MPAQHRPHRPLWNLSVLTSPEAEEAAGELLLRLTGETPVITQSRETGWSTAQVFLQDPAQAPERVRARVAEGLRAIAACGLDVRPARIRWRRVPEADWRESWRRHFVPLQIGRSLLVRPSWSRRRALKGQATVILDPGLSFGTGHHPTTAYCLREIVRFRPRRDGALGLLDAGTGSGILAIAAARLGYRRVEAFDFDPEAVRVARENAAANGVLDRIRLEHREVGRLSLRPARARRFGVVCANLTADVLQPHAARLLAHLAQGGHLVVAGILDGEFDRLQACFEALGAHLVRSSRRREWRSGTFAVTPDLEARVPCRDPSHP